MSENEGAGWSVRDVFTDTAELWGECDMACHGAGVHANLHSEHCRVAAIADSFRKIHVRLTTAPTLPPAIAARESAPQGGEWPLGDSDDDLLNVIRLKCEQFWNEHNLNDAEVHTTLEFIHARACKLLKRRSESARDGERLALVRERTAFERGRQDGLMTALGVANAYDYDPVGRSIVEILRPHIRALEADEREVIDSAISATASEEPT
jgi:hypothetical protein